MPYLAENDAALLMNGVNNIFPGLDLLIVENAGRMREPAQHYIKDFDYGYSLERKCKPKLSEFI